MVLNLNKKFELLIVLVVILLPFSILFFPIYEDLNNNPDINNKLNLNSFTPVVNLDSIPPINYQPLNELWYKQKAEMLIIINDTSYLDAVTPLVDWKNYKGVNTIVLYNYSLYEGRDKAEKIRNMIKSFYLTQNIRWVLLAGDTDENLIPIRYVYNPDTAEIDGESEYSNWDEYFKPTDFYYSDLSGTWDDNGNGRFGESSSKSGNIDEISWTPDVYIGRLPASDPIELSDMINKTLNYEKTINVGDWMNKMLLAGGISSYYPPEDEARLTEYIWQNYVLSNMNFTHLVKTTTSFNPTSPPLANQLENLNNTSFRNNLNSGYSTIIFAGHGDPTRFTDASSVNFYSNTDALSSSNVDMPSLVYADVCTTSSYDKGDDSIGERLIKQSNSGAIGYIGGIRVTWYFENDTNLEKLNRANAKLFWKEFFEEKKFQQGMALYDSKVSYINSDYFDQASVSTEQEWERKNLLAYNLLGDPEVDIYTNIPISASNSFTGTYYEGQLVALQIKDIHNNTVPYARLNFKTEDGKNRTVYADKNGNIKFRLPAQANENFSVLITGHNLIPTHYNFITIPDSDQPIISNVYRYPTDPTISDNIFFSVKAYDNHSGIESIILLLFKDNINDVSIHRIINDFDENNFDFNLTLNKLEPGMYSFMFLARDYSNKTTYLYEGSFNFIIERPFSDYAFLVSSIMIIGLASISSSILIKNVKKYKDVSKEIKKK